MPPKQLILTETEWQHIYGLLKEDMLDHQLWARRFRNSDDSGFHKIFAELDEGLLKKFDETPDYIEPRNCIDCGSGDYHGFVLEHHVWVELKLNYKTTNICMECVQKRLGRPLDFDKDLRLCPLNFFCVPGFDNKERMRRNILQDGTPEDSPWFKRIDDLYDENGNPRKVEL